MISFPPKESVAANYQVIFDFIGVLPEGVEGDTADIEAEVISGVDNAVDILGNLNTVDGTRVLVEVQNGVSGVIYGIQVDLTGDDGLVYTLKGTLAVL